MNEKFRGDLETVLNKEGMAVLEINCSETDQPEEFIGDFTSNLQSMGEYSVAYVSPYTQDSIYHVIIQRGRKNA